MNSSKRTDNAVLQYEKRDGVSDYYLKSIMCHMPKWEKALCCVIAKLTNIDRIIKWIKYGLVMYPAVTPVIVAKTHKYLFSKLPKMSNRE